MKKALIKPVSMLMRVLLLGMFVSPAAGLAESTISQTIESIHYNATTEDLYVVGKTKWGSQSCPNAFYAWFRPNLPGRVQLVSILMAAHAAGKPVKLSGSCSSVPDHFEAVYVVVE